MSKGKESGNLFRVVHKKGTHLASSNDTTGAYRGNLLDDETNKPIGNAEWVKVDEDDYDYGVYYDYEKSSSEVELSEEEKELAAFLGEVIAAGTIWVFNEVVAPRVKFWWQDQAIPNIKKTWNGITEKKKRKQTKGVIKVNQNSNTEIASTRRTVPEIFSEELDEAYGRYLNDMTNEEAQKELLDIFILSTILAAKIRKLSNARIRKDGDIPGEYIEGQQVVEKLSSPEFMNSINKILENNRSLLEEKSATIVEILGHRLVLDGQYVPIENSRIREVLGSTF